MLLLYGHIALLWSAIWRSYKHLAAPRPKHNYTTTVDAKV